MVAAAKTTWKLEEDVIEIDNINGTGEVISIDDSENSDNSCESTGSEAEKRK